jgi:ribulose-phosphate 3-epimerase
VTNLPLDVHLMVEHPENLLEAFARAGASHLIVHVETCPQIARTISTIKSLGCRAGVTLNPATPARDLEPALALADLVLVLTVHPGYSGQAFMTEMVPKVAEVRNRLDEIKSSAWLETDGGLTVETIPMVRDAGANAFVSASAVFQHPGGIAAGLRSLRTAIAILPAETD